jgi:hypothetical protein
MSNKVSKSLLIKKSAKTILLFDVVPGLTRNLF